jgi:5-oxoprolinase (ATP-hydrolysing)
METILVPPDAGLLSALGVGHAPVEKIRERQVLRRLDEVEHELPRWLDRLAAEAAEAVVADGVAADQVVVRRRIASLRYVGQDTSLQVEVLPTRSLAEGFARRFLALYGHRPEGRPIEVESMRVIAASAPIEIGSSPGTTDEGCFNPTEQAGEIRAYFGGVWQQVPCFERETLRPGDLLDRSRPAVVMDRHSTLIKEPGWSARVNPCGGIVLHREHEHEEAAAVLHRPGRRAAPVELELFVGRLSAIAEEMGELLRRTALSTNIKERRDFSCALLDARGQLVVNAPHIPVHLGSLGLCVRQLAEALPLGPGDVAVTNHPAFGGSHLPDVTVVTPVHHGPSDELLGYLASRAHHAEIGGVTPGSMPPGASCLAEEGVVIPPCHLVSSGKPRWDELQHRLERAAFPSRAVQDNLADIRAAVAANHLGARALRGLAESHGATSVRRFMDALQTRGERRIRRALQILPDGSYRGQASLDDGSPLSVRVTITGDAASIDLSGSAPVHPGNLNATPAIVHGVVIYVLRLLVDRPLPLNEGMMRAISLHIPTGLLNPPFEGDPAQLPAVMGGNVETSQRLTDLLLRTLKMAACSQGTMNNVVFGTQRFGYYETVGGGAGAGPGFSGESAVHSHMTNTRITDVEVLEHRYPVRLERFALRRDSGGRGRFCGGDGAIREYTFLEPVTLSILSQRRASGPCGLEGGAPGKPGSQRVIRSSGEIEELGAVDGREIGPGDRLLLETPGGGGYGEEGGRPTRASTA